jgi:ATP-dependent DNA helicase PIF1
MTFNLPQEYNWISMNPDLEKAFELLYSTNRHLNIIGPAGVGKTLLLKIICSDTKAFGNTVVLSSTGIAAVNASSEGLKGSTIHSFLKLKPQTIYGSNSLHIHKELYEIVNSVDTILIDEVSMINSSLFDFVIETLLLYRSKQMQDLPRIILFGDILQLPPVIDSNNNEIKKYFNMLYNDKVMYFNANSFYDLGFETIHLNTIYRQSDQSFQNILNRIRQATHTIQDINTLNDYVIDEGDFWDRHENFLHIATTNNTVDLLNVGDLHANENQIKHYDAIVSGRFDEALTKHLPLHVSLKKGLQVMCTRNDPSGERSFQNGTIGTIEELYDEYVIISSKGRNINVPRVNWELYDYKVTHDKDKEKTEVHPEKVGTFNQLAVKGARAITVHRAQGQTVETAYIDLGYKVFAPGLTYVALSRVPDCDKGLGLKRKIKMSDIYASREALDFLNKF